LEKVVEILAETAFRSGFITIVFLHIKLAGKINQRFVENSR
jgi:hypothetical protein